MAAYLISRDNFLNLLGTLQKDYSVYIPLKKDENRFFTRFKSDEKDKEDGHIVFGEVRTVEPLKVFYMRSRERVAEGFKDELPSTGAKPSCIVGVKACDLKGFQVQDRVFRDDEYKDPFYIREREENLIISADCTCAIDTCYCLALHVNPYPQSNYDINITVENTGSVTLKTTYFNILINGIDKPFSCSKKYLYPENEVYFNVSNLQATGDTRLKIITNNGISNYYDFTLP